MCDLTAFLKNRMPEKTPHKGYAGSFVTRAFKYAICSKKLQVKARKSFYLGTGYNYRQQ